MNHLPLLAVCLMLCGCGKQKPSEFVETNWATFYAFRTAGSMTNTLTTVEVVPHNVRQWSLESARIRAADLGTNEHIIEVVEHMTNQVITYIDGKPYATNMNYLAVRGKIDMIYGETIPVSGRISYAADPWVMGVEVDSKTGYFVIKVNGVPISTNPPLPLKPMTYKLEPWKY